MKLFNSAFCVCAHFWCSFGELKLYKLRWFLWWQYSFLYIYVPSSSLIITYKRGITFYNVDCSWMRSIEKILPTMNCLYLFCLATKCIKINCNQEKWMWKKFKICTNNYYATFLLLSSLYRSTKNASHY